MVIQSMMPQLQRQSGSSNGKKEELDEKKKKVVLDEKHFRRMDKSSIGSSTWGLAEEVRKLMSREDTRRFPDGWNPKEDVEVDQVVYNKYKTELYGVLMSLTSGEPLGRLRRLQDTQLQFDGYEAIVALSVALSQ
eukprot:8862083-Karenia_brevis.AAC.1